jgi:hypothetical protein
MNTEERAVRKKELLMELERLQKEEKQEKQLERFNRAQFLYNNIEAIIALSKHSKRTCDDVNLNNAEYGCIRCIALKSRRFSQWYDIDFDVRIELVQLDQL